MLTMRRSHGVPHRIIQRIKAFCLLIFGITLIVCYGSVSATFHGVRLNGEPLYRLQRLDHVGIYLLIAGTAYTPVAWSLMRGSWSWGTLTTGVDDSPFCAPSESMAWGRDADLGINSRVS